MRWSKVLVSGNEQIDKEHKDIIKLANELEKAIKNKERETIHVLLVKFQEDVKEHFISEENFMREHEYTLLDAHRKLHQNYLLLLEDVINTYQTSKSISGLTEDFTKACNEMSRHILHYDIPVLKKLQRKSR